MTLLSQPPSLITREDRKARRVRLLAARIAQLPSRLGIEETYLERPERTILVLLTDLFHTEGDNAEFVKRMRALVDAKVKTLVHGPRAVGRGATPDGLVAGCPA